VVVVMVVVVVAGGQVVVAAAMVVRVCLQVDAIAATRGTHTCERVPIEATRSKKMAECLR
jgi:hypothetical protein